jgi:steroid 5-alpha reductase family enzyme
MSRAEKSKTFSLLICLAVYIVSIVAAWYSTFFFTPGYNLLVVALFADIVATVVVYIFGVIFKNASLYDPYWSVAPPVIIGYWIVQTQDDFTTVSVLIFLVTLLWSIRLTLNWARGWRGLGHEDWRYTKLRNDNPKIYPFVNLAGIHLFPTTIVFVCLIPAWYAVLQTEATLNITVLGGAIISIAGTLLSFIADEQMRAFKNRSMESASIETGLWQYSRHPNYLGEILFWLGIWVMAVGVNVNLWWTIFGWVALTLMFVYISIPMMEKRNLAKRADYADLIRRIPMLLPIPKKNQGSA